MRWKEVKLVNAFSKGQSSFLQRASNGTTSFSHHARRGMFAILHCLVYFTLSRSWHTMLVWLRDARITVWDASVLTLICLLLLLLLLLCPRLFSSAFEKVTTSKTVDVFYPYPERWEQKKNKNVLCRVLSILMLIVCCILLKHMLWVWFCRDLKKEQKKTKQNKTKKETVTN